MTDLALPSTSSALDRPAARLTLGRLVAVALPGGLVAAALDAVFAVVAYVFVLHRFSFVGALQYIASGLLGPSAFAGGLAAAALGVVMHLGLALGFSVLFVLAARRLPRLTRGGAALAGLVYGAVVGATMYFMVVPLTAAPPSHDSAAFIVAFLADHALFVGLPIALLAAARTGREPSPEV